MSNANNKVNYSKICRRELGWVLYLRAAKLRTVTRIQWFPSLFQAYEEVLKYPEDELRNLLEEVTRAGKTKDKNSLSPHALVSSNS